MPLRPEHKITWENNDPVQLYLLEDLMDDMGLGDGDGPLGKVVRGKTREYIIRILSQTQLTMGQVENDGHVYYAGYLDCLQNMSMEKLRECGFKL